MRIVTLVLVVGAVVGLAASASASETKALVSVKLVEFKVIPTPTRAARGSVTFAAKNRGKINHQLVVLKTNIPPAKLPVKNAKAVETGKVGSIRVIKPGKTVTLTLQLKAAKYVLLCNLAGHYQAGQRAALTVS